MKTLSRFSLWAVAFAATAGTTLRATEPETGGVLVLDNERTLEGQIERVGDQYRIRRTVGETWLPANKALCVCGSREEAYQFLRGRANLRDPDEHLRLARWCQSHELRGLALDEVTTALQLRPKHLEGQRLYRSLQQSAAANTPSPARRPPVEPPLGPPSMALLTEFNSESIGLFVTRVQPILMNTCAACHASGRGGAFKLMRTHGDGRNNSRITQQNLAAVLGQMNRERLSASPLLTRAVLAHGDADQPPIKSRQAPAYRSLEEWARRALASSDGKDIVPDATSVPPATARIPTTFAEPSKPVAKPVESSTKSKPAADSATKNAPADPFDPAEFNRRVHPDR